MIGFGSNSGQRGFQGMMPRPFPAGPQGMAFGSNSGGAGGLQTMTPRPFPAGQQTMGNRRVPPRGPNLAQQTAGAFGDAISATDRAQGIANGALGAIDRASDITQRAINGGAPLSQFMNPYTNQVINRTMGDMNRARQTALNDVGAQADAAGAFGGSRHGLVEAQTNAEFGRAAGDMAAGLRQQGYRDAVDDRLNERQFRLSGAGQMLGAANQRLGVSQQMLGIGGQRQSIANQGMGFQSQIAGQQMAQGEQQRQMMQQLIDAQRAQFSGFTGQGSQALSGLLAAIGAAPYSTSSTTTQRPSLLQAITSFL